MEYICHHRFRGITAGAGRMNIPYGSKFQTIGKFIATEGSAGICYIDSDVANRHFARNDDGRGGLRGALTYAIAYSKRERKHEDGHIFRLSEDEIAMLMRDYPHFLKDTETILFNHNFFHAEIAELKELAAKLGIKVKGA